jgi:hypothetical protein
MFVACGRESEQWAAQMAAQDLNMQNLLFDAVDRRTIVLDQLGTRRQ